MRRFLCLCVLTLGVTRPAAAQAPAATEPEPIFRLPDFTVTDSSVLPKPEAWRHAEVAGFEMLSNASDRAANRLLRDFARFREVLDIVWPVPMRRPAVSTLILAGRGGKFADFLPPRSRENAAGVVSLFFRDREQAAIVLDLESATIELSGNTSPNEAGAGTVRLEVEPSRQLNREYVRFLLNESEPPQPLWYQEGLLQIIMDVQFTDKTIVFAKVLPADDESNQVTEVPGSAGAVDDEVRGFQEFTGGDRPFNIALRQRRLMPLAEFFAVTTDSPAARNPLGDNLWAKQCYAFVHLCLYGEFGRFKPGFEQFVQRLQREPVSEQLFQECFKLSYRQMLERIRRHVEVTQHTYQRYTLQPGSELSAVAAPAWRDATQGEVGRIKGDAQRLAGLTDAARLSYRTAYVRGEHDPRLLGALGLAEANAGQTDRARPLLEAAARSDQALPSTLVALARLRLDEVRAAPRAPDGQLDAPQVAAVLGPLHLARTRPRRSPAPTCSSRRRGPPAPLRRHGPTSPCSPRGSSASRG